MVPLQELELHLKTLGECLQRYQALNHICKQSNWWARRPGSCKAREVQPALALCHSAKLSVCVSVTIYVLWVWFIVVCQVTQAFSNIKAPACQKQVQIQTLWGGSLHQRSSWCWPRFEDSPPQSTQYVEPLEVVNRVVAKLNIDWPAEKPAELQKSKLDECFLRTKPLPPCLSLPFFENHSRPAYSSSDYYVNVTGLGECGNRTMPRVEQTLAIHLSPGMASSLKAPVLPSKPIRTTSALVGKGVLSSASGWCVSAHYVSVTGIPSQPAKIARRRLATQVRRYLKTKDYCLFSYSCH